MFAKMLCIVMMLRIFSIALVAWGGLAAVDSSSVTGDDQPASQVNAAMLFYTRIRPLLKAKCMGCHGDDQKKIKAKLDMRTRAGLIKGGENGAALTPGEPTKSAMYLAVTWKDKDFQMPPKERNRLTADQVQLIRQWIEGGAPWPTKADPSWTSDDPNALTMNTSGGLTDDWTNRKYKRVDLWGYFPAKRYNVPWKAIGTDADERTANPIDAFVLRKLNAAGISPADSTDRRTLIRRVTFDLTGLPPTPTEVDAFVNDKSPKAFEELVDRLLASPRYGERMAQHWLDRKSVV